MGALGKAMAACILTVHYSLQVTFPSSLSSQHHDNLGVVIKSVLEMRKPRLRVVTWLAQGLTAAMCDRAWTTGMASCYLPQSWRHSCQSQAAHCAPA